MKNKKHLIVKDNALINASYSLDLVEQRLILLGIVETREKGIDIDAMTPIFIHASTYADVFKVTKEAAYSALKGAAQSLFNRQFSYSMKYKGSIGIMTSRWISSIFYADENGELAFTFASEVIPLITRLESHFTSYELQQVASLKSRYAVRLYEILIAWKSTGKIPQLELDELRAKLGLETEDYPRLDTFKRRVLDLAVEQINQHTDITVQYKQHKRGRAISGFSFTFKQKRTDKKPLETKRDQNTLDLFSKMTDAQRYLFANKLSELPEMNTYSQGTESYQQFAVRIAEMLQDPQKFQKLFPYLEKVGFKAG